LSQLLTPQVWAIPLGLFGVGTQFWLGHDWTFITVASMLTALLGIVSQPFRRVIDDWNFHVSKSDQGLLLRHGLLETRNQTVPVRRVQAVAVTRPLLWRGFNWLRVRLDVAGYTASGDERGERHVDRLLPVGTPDTARMLIGEAMGEDIAALRYVPVPGRARWLSPFAAGNLATALSHTAVAGRTGWLTIEDVVVAYPRIQSVRVRQGPLQRLLRLASVQVDTAGGVVATLEHRTTSEAYYLAGLLADHARVARRAAAAPPALG
jgi:putative membrane protein